MSCGGGGMGSGAATAFVETKWCGERKGARAPLPSLHREKAVDSGSGEGGRNEGAEAARAFGARAAWHTREPMLRSRESSISHGSDVQHVGVDKGEGRYKGRGQCVEARLPRA